MADPIILPGSGSRMGETLAILAALAIAAYILLTRLPKGARTAAPPPLERQAPPAPLPRLKPRPEQSQPWRSSAGAPRAGAPVPAPGPDLVAAAQPLMVNVPPPLPPVSMPMGAIPSAPAIYTNTASMSFKPTPQLLRAPTQARPAFVASPLLAPAPPVPKPVPSPPVLKATALPIIKIPFGPTIRAPVPNALSLAAAKSTGPAVLQSKGFLGGLRR